MRLKLRNKQQVNNDARGEKASAKTHRVRRVVCWVLAIVALVVLVGVNVGLTLFEDTVASYLNSDHVDVTSEQKASVMETGRSLAESIEGEGLVLLQNNNQTLPLSSDTKKVNVFGWASTQWVASGSGSGQVSGSTTSILDALSAQGVEYNTQLTDMYRGFQGERPYKSAGALNSRSTEFSRLYEPSIYDKNCYSQELLDSALAYSDTALVVISRTTGESNDCPQAQYKVSQRNGQVEVDSTRTYLELSTEEEALLRYVGSHYENVVVLVNSTNTMELGQVETITGIDSCLLVGTTGEVGANAVVKALWGEINPSGRTTDTYAYDMTTAASWANSGAMGEGIYTNGSGLYPADGTSNANVGVSESYDAVRFVDYCEGIYVGYRWYETADAEGYWDSVSNVHGTGYQGVVQYPFGYGLSYTTFDWEVVDSSHGDHYRVERDTQVSRTVRVTNTGTVAGRDVVEMYVTVPYTSGGIEKPSTQLVAYAKTKLLEPGESVDVTLSFTMDDVASYDYNDANGNGFCGYELESGSYIVELKHDSHTLDDCEGASLSLYLARNTQCETDLVTGAAVSNHFTGDSAEDGVSIDGSNSNANITWLSRADFAGTFPHKSDADREMTDNVKALNLYNEDQVEADAQEFATSGNDLSVSQPPETTASDALKLSEDGVITTFGKQLGSNYNDEGWDTLLDSISIADMEKLVLHGYLATTSIDAIGKPRTKEVDGPSQVGSFNQLQYGVGYPNATVLAQTWNDSLAYEYGQQVGMECACLGVDGWYAPSVNIHRSPLGGRNYEYYSEDGLIAGNMGASVVSGSLSTGTYCYMKHLACNNQDTYRDSIYTWLTEQSLREIYLKPFKIAVQKGGCTGMMSAYNRIGATWAGGNKALLTDVLRNEWGFQGAVITDYCDHHQYMNADAQLRAGGDLYMDGVFRNGEFAYGYSQTDAVRTIGTDEQARAASYVYNLRRATKDVLYTWLNARTSATVDRPIKTEGIKVSTLLLVLDLAAAAIAGLLVVRHFRRKKRA